MSEEEQINKPNWGRKESDFDIFGKPKTGVGMYHVPKPGQETYAPGLGQRTGQHMTQVGQHIAHGGIGTRDALDQIEEQGLAGKVAQEVSAVDKFTKNYQAEAELKKHEQKGEHPILPLPSLHKEI